MAAYHTGHLGCTPSCTYVFSKVSSSKVLRCLFTRTNVLIRRFWCCSLEVKLRLSRTYCMCFYDMSLWKYYKVGSMKKLAAAYIKCIYKDFLWQRKIQQCYRYVICCYLLDLGLPCFSTLLHNARFRFSTRLNHSVNSQSRNANCF